MSQDRDERESMHRRIFESTSIVGGSSAINVLFRVIQAKAVAVLLGPAGVGLMGLLNAALAVGVTISSVGLSTSGVRRIAEASNRGVRLEAAQTIAVFRTVALLCAIAGSLLFLALRQQIAQLTFGNTVHVAAVAVTSGALFLTVVSGAEQTVIRGLRRVTDLAWSTVFGVAAGTVLGLVLLIKWGIDGVAPYLVLTAGSAAVASWLFAHRGQLPRVRLTWSNVRSESRELLSLGAVFMVTGLVTITATYLLKVLITRQLGLEVAGLYEAASTLSNVYVGFILSAMAADFFPHLAEVSGDPHESNRLVNAQVEVGLLIATPGILVMLALGPLLLTLLYSDGFAPAFEILRWQVLGTFIRVISWPLGFLTLTNGRGSWFFVTELATNAVYLVAVSAFLRFAGVAGIGLAFFVMYIFHLALMTVVGRRLIGFSWSRANLRLAIRLLPVTLMTFVAGYLVSPAFSLAIGLVLAVGVAIFSWRSLINLIGPEATQTYVLRLRALTARFRR